MIIVPQKHIQFFLPTLEFFIMLTIVKKIRQKRFVKKIRQKIRQKTPQVTSSVTH